jgi:hypothetical protein
VSQVLAVFRPDTELQSSDYPGLFEAADLASGRGQRLFLRMLRTKLVLATLAAISGTFALIVGGIDAAAVFTTLAFASAFAIELYLEHTEPTKAWYEGRALAESVKTLTWRYAVGGVPCPRTLPEDKAKRVLLDRVRALEADLSTVPLLPTTRGVITPRMRELRAAPLAERKRAYLDGRIQDQQEWYAGKAEYHQRRLRLFRTSVLALNLIGVCAATVKIFGLVSFDLAGVVAASLASLAAWVQARQHAATAAAYVIASHELSIISELLRQDMPEDEWATVVADAEDAISREHTLWRASHGE